MAISKVLDRVHVDGGYLELSSAHGYLTISIGDRVLMSSAAHGSEEQMARRALGHLSNRGRRRRAPVRVLVGGLGLGYTLRAVLDQLEPDDVVEVAELLPAIVRWHREGPLGELARRPLEDPRTTLRREDVQKTLALEKGSYDAILLDVDNGPSAMVAKGNARLYDAQGIALCRDALAPDGTLIVWSNGPDEAYLKRLRAAGLRARVEITGAQHATDAGLRHWLFVATH